MKNALYNTKMEKMRLCSLFSGGKDSVMALYKGMEEHEVAVMLSMIPRSDDSYMYHIPNIRFTNYSAEAIGLPLITKETTGRPPQENEDLRDALSEIKEEYKINGVCAGAVHSNYQYNIVKKICEQLDLKVYAPYWQKNHEELIKDALSAGFEIIIVGTYADGLDDKWLGRKIDYKALEELKKLNNKYGVDVGGEGGEYETFVLDGPIYKKKLVIEKAEKRWDKVRGEYIIEKIRLTSKS